MKPPEWLKPNHKLDRWKASQAQNRSKYLKAAVLYQELDLIKIQSARFAKNRSESVEIDIEQQIPDSRCLCSIL
ncbi:hypothetical protein EBR96_01875 [bacterium]|nr:hypothetical protein [bacterium]